MLEEEILSGGKKEDSRGKINKFILKTIKSTTVNHDTGEEDQS